MDFQPCILPGQRYVGKRETLAPVGEGQPLRRGIGQLSSGWPNNLIASVQNMFSFWLQITTKR